jgi:succinate-semialdehyde dehydrogenase/glutarate-semialdehyde dehydrogenase
VHNAVKKEFLSRFCELVSAIRPGRGDAEGTTMGPLANVRRVGATQDLVANALTNGAHVAWGGQRPSQPGYFHEPTVLSDVETSARCMNEEPFGPLAIVNGFDRIEDAIAEANRLPFGLAAYAYTSSLKNRNLLARSIESGMVSINHHGVGLPETPFGGVKDSGYGSEGGLEAMEAYLNTKFVTEAAQ